MNNYAVTAAGIGEAMRRSAASMDVANNSIEETAALITGGAEVTQDYEGVGNALKVVSMRLRGSKGELEEMGEEVDENVENLTKMQGQILNLTHGKVNIFKENGDFESTYEILQGIAEVWDDLTDLEQADLLETISGKHRANTVASIIGNWENVEASYASALNSTGSAAKENEKYMDSLQGRLNELTTAFQSFSNTAMSSGFLKGLVDMGSGILNILDTIIDKVGLLPTLIGAVTAGFTANGKQGFFKVIEDESAMFGVKMTNTFKDIANISKGTNIQPVFDAGFIADVDAGAEAIRNYKRAINNDMDVDEAQLKYFSEANDGLREYIENTGINQISGDKWALSEKKKQLALKASNHSLANCNSIIKAYGDETARAGLTQAQYAAEVSRGNKVLGSYLSGLGTANGSLKGYIAKLVASKAATVALTAASMAMNAVLTMGIGFAISGLISLISKAINYADDLANKVSEATSSYKEQHGELVQNKSDFEALAESYAKLSKGVDSKTGKNISLMPSEYEEYQDVVNQIADTIPSLIAGYDAQGNAILNCAGDVDTLTEAYNNLIIAQNNKLLNGDGEDYEGISEISKDLSIDYEKLSDTGVNGDKLTMLGSKQLGKILDADNIDESTVAQYAGNMRKQIGTSLKNEFEKRGIELEGVEMPSAWSKSETWDKFIAEACREHPEVAHDIINNLESEMDSATQEMRTAMGAYMENAFLGGQYSNIDDEMQSIAKSIVGGLDSNLVMRLNESGGEEAVTDYVDNILNTLNGMDVDTREKFKGMFDLSESFANDDMSLGEYKKQLEEASQLIENSGLSDEVKVQLKTELNTEGVQSDWQSFVNRMTETSDKMDYNAAVDFANSLTASEWAAAQELVVRVDAGWKDKTSDEIKAEIESLAKVTDAMNFTIDIEGETEGIEKVNTALAESASAAGVSAESLESLRKRYASLDSYNPAALFEKTSQGIKLNTDEVKRLEREMANTKLEDVSTHLETLKDAYGNVTEKINTCGDSTKRLSLIAEQQSYVDQINQLSEMQAQYEGLTSAYNNWINAQESGEEGDVYDDVMEKLESAAELKKQGLVGTNEFAAAVEFMSGKDTTSMSVDEIVSAYDKALPKMERYFTEGSDGVNNLLNDISSLNEEWAHLDENGEWDIDMSVEDMANAAEQLDVSVEVLEAVLGKGSDYGLDINYDSVYEASESLETLRTDAQNANEKLKEIGKTDLTFSFESTNAKDLTNQIANATKMAEQFKNSDGTWNMEIDGAEDAQQILSALILQKQEVTKPDFMEVSVATIGDENLGNVIQAMQQIQTYKNLYEINVAIGADTSDATAGIAETIGKLQTLQQENPQVFADLGLNTNEFNSALSTLDANITAGVELDSSALATVQSSLDGINTTVLAKVGIGDTSALNNMTGNASVTPTPTTTDLGDGFTGSGKIDVSPKTTDLGSGFTGSGKISMTPYLTNSTVTVTVKENKVSEATGTAHLSGSAYSDGAAGRAFARGNWGIKGNGIALAGELGQELVVRQGRFFTVGDNGAEFFQYQPNDIIFNARQTEELFKYGGIKGAKPRGTMLASGTAFAEGMAFSTGIHGGGHLYGGSSSGSSSSSSKSSSSKSKSSSSSSSANEEEEEFSEVLDWIEVKIDRIERAISRLDLKASSTFKKWTTRNSALVKEIAKVGEEIEIQNAGYDRYMQEAASVGLSSEYQRKVQNGEIDIESIDNEDLKEKIDEYQQW